MIKKSLLSVALVASTLLTSSAYADARGFYLGGGIGSATYDDGGVSTTVGGSEVETSDSGYKVYAGFQFGRVFALEGSYTDYGTYAAKIGSYSYAAQSVTVAANLGYSFLDEQLRPFALLGISVVQEDHTNLLPQYATINDFASAFHYGIGFQYEPNVLKGLGFRIAYESDLYLMLVEDPTGSSKTYTQNSGLLYASVQYKF